jgi:hypothetical protein
MANKEIMIQWRDALKSGEFRQAKGKLRTDSGYCCLGVLCELHLRKVREDGEDLSWRRGEYETSDGSRENEYDYLGSDLSLPDTVRLWAELPDCNPSIDGIDLSTHNDGGVDGDLDLVPRKTFEEIAELIDKHFIQEHANDC